MCVAFKQSLRDIRDYTKNPNNIHVIRVPEGEKAELKKYLKK